MLARKIREHYNSFRSKINVNISMPSNETILEWCNTYKNAKHTPQTAHYKVFLDWITKQYEFIQSLGVHIYLTGDNKDPYKSVEAMQLSINRHNTFFCLSSGNIFMPNHSLSLVSPFKTYDNEALLYNDCLRIVHDFIGHYAFNYTFNTYDEFIVNAYQMALTDDTDVQKCLLQEFSYQTAYYSIVKDYTIQKEF